MSTQSIVQEMQISACLNMAAQDLRGRSCRAEASHSIESILVGRLGCNLSLLAARNIGEGSTRYVPNDKRLRTSTCTRGHVRPFVFLARICVHGQIDVSTAEVRKPFKAARGGLLLIVLQFLSPTRGHLDETAGRRLNQAQVPRGHRLWFEPRKETLRYGLDRQRARQLGCMSSWPTGTSATLPIFDSRDG